MVPALPHICGRVEEVIEQRAVCWQDDVDPLKCADHELHGWRVHPFVECLNSERVLWLIIVEVHRTLGRGLIGAIGDSLFNETLKHQLSVLVEK